MQANIKHFFGKRKADSTGSTEAACHKHSLRTDVESQSPSKEDVFLDDYSDASSESESDDEDAYLTGTISAETQSEHPQTTFQRPPGPEDLSNGRTEGPMQPKHASFPATQFGNKRRSFRSAWYDTYSWLEYSTIQDAAFCFSCRMFPVPNKPQTENNFISVGFKQWKKANEKDAGFAQHERSDYHNISFCSWKYFQDHMRKGATIDVALKSTHEKTISGNRHYVKQIARVLCLTARQKIAQRGHRESIDSENRGNFLEILDLLSEQDEVVQKRLRGQQRVKYTSPQVQNDILSVMAQMIRSTISKEVSSSGDYSVMLDESKDISKREQLSVVVRYVYNNSIHEEFLDFERLKELNAPYLKDKLCNVLTACEIKISDCVAQTYDGASVMSGCNKGVQALFRKENAPHAVYIHCYNHRLNLVIVDSVKSVRMAENFFSFLEELYVYMTAHVPYEIFLTKQKELFPGKQTRTLKKLSDTRWACQYVACKVVLDTMKCVIATLSDIAELHTGKRAHDARNLLMNITFPTLVCLVMFTHILRQTKLLSDMLQSPSLDLSAAADEIESVQEDLQEQRCEKVWQSIWQECTDLAKTLEIDVVPPTKRTGRLPRRLADSYVMTTTGHQDQISNEEQYRTSLYYPVMDTLLAELATRFDSANRDLLRSISALDPKSSKFLHCEHLSTMAEQYAVNKEYMDIELRQAKRLIEKKQSDGVKVSSIGEFARFMGTYKEAFPDLCRLLNIALVLPPTSASCERSFSSMRHIKSYLRSTMSDTKLSSLGVIGIHAMRAKELDMEEFVNIFAARHNNRKIQLF